MNDEAPGPKSRGLILAAQPALDADGEDVVQFPPELKSFRLFHDEPAGEGGSILVPDPFGIENDAVAVVSFTDEIGLEAVEAPYENGVFTDVHFE